MRRHPHYLGGGDAAVHTESLSVMKERVPYDACAAHCLEGGSSLPCVRNMTQAWQVLRGSEFSALWLGLYQDTNAQYRAEGWSWANGCSSNPIWEAGEPNWYLGEAERCSMLADSGAGPKVFDVPCHIKLHCSCEGLPPTERYLAWLDEVTAELDERAAAALGAQWDDVVVSLCAALLLLAVPAVLLCCCLCPGCAWRSHLRKSPPSEARSAAEPARETRCFGVVVPHQQTREAHGRVRVRTEAFDGIRGLCALQVAVGHYCTFYTRLHVDIGGGNAVLVFFIMSGFVMQVGYAPGGPADGSCCCCGGCCAGCGGEFARKFWSRRLARIGPLTWLSVVWSLPMAAVASTVPHRTALLPAWAQGTLLAANAAAAATFTQMYTPGLHEVNPPLWTVCAQWFFYALFPWLTDRLHVARSGVQLTRAVLGYWAVYLVSWCALFATAHSDSHISGPGNGHPTHRTESQYLLAHENPFNKLPLCIIGVVLGSQALVHAGRARDRGPEATRRWSSVANGLSAAVGGYSALAPIASPAAPFIFRFCGELLFPPVYAAWLYALTQAPACASASLLRSRPLARLGSWSFALYTLHWAFLGYYAALRDAVLRRTAPPGRSPVFGEGGSAWEIAIWLPLLLALCFAVHHGVERPLRGRLQRVLEPTSHSPSPGDAPPQASTSRRARAGDSIELVTADSAAWVADAAASAAYICISV